MTYIRYVAVGGFKSLRDWNLLELSPRVSVLVGGNGTGKSSLVEALLWALGEGDHEQLRAMSAADLVFRPPATARPAFRMEDILFHTTRPGRDEEDGPPETEEASVYLVMGEEGEVCQDEHDEACCCKRRTDQSARELPGGTLSVGRSVDRDGRDRWELDGAPAEAARVQAALARHTVDRETVSVIRQGELERILAADDRLRARIIASAAGIRAARSEDLRERRLDLETEREWLAAELARLAGVAARAVPGVPGLTVSHPVEWDGLGHAVLAALRERERSGGVVSLRAAEAAELLGLESVPGAAAAPVGVATSAVESRRAELEERLRTVERGLEEVERDEVGRARAERRSLAAAVGRVAERADRYFQALVVGGSLRVTLVDADTERPAPAGGEPQATAPAAAVSVAFPGQPELHLDALSGGQRALAAFALGVAVLEETPSRLMVLDEVEPALDESNLRRFNELLQGIAATRQVVIVSHQRRTKEVGDVVFGVDHLGEGASGLLFRFEPSTRRLVVFGKTRGNWLDRNAPELQEDGGVALTGPRSEGKNVRWGR